VAVVACRVDRQIDAILNLNHPRARVHRARVHRARVLHLPDQDLPVHPVRIAMAHHLVAVPQVVVTHPIAAHIQEDHPLHVEILPVQVHVHHQIVVMALHQDHLPTAGSAVTDQEIHARLPIVLPVHTEIATHALHQDHLLTVAIVQPVVHTAIAIHDQVHVHLLIEANVVTVHAIPAHQVTDQPVVHTAIAIHDQVHVQVLIAPIVRPVHTETEIPVQVHARHQIAQLVVHTETEIHVQVLIVQQVAHTVTETHVALRVDRQIDAMALRQDHLPIVVTVQHEVMVIDQSVVTLVRHLTVQHAVMVIDQSVVTLVRHLTVQPVVHMATEIHVRHHVRHQIVQLVVPMLIVIPDQVQIVQIVPVAKTHTVAIVHAQAMTATRVHLRVTANAAVVPIVPEVASQMTAKNVHAVALAKSA